MIVMGAGGFAKELLQVLISEKYNLNVENLYFFDNVNDNVSEKLFGKYQVLKSFKEVKNIFQTVSPEFCLGVGSPQSRYILSNKAIELGGKLTTIISENSHIGTFGVSIEKGVTVMQNTTITNSVKIGKGTIINLDCTIGHDVKIGEYSEIMPGVNISGRCKIGNYTTIGTGVIITPKIKIGNNCFIVAGSVITNDIPDDSFVVGIVPSRVVKKLPEFEE